VKKKNFILKNLPGDCNITIYHCGAKDEGANQSKARSEQRMKEDKQQQASSTHVVQSCSLIIHKPFNGK
jgi:hypothetical protein